MISVSSRLLSTRTGSEARTNEHGVSVQESETAPSKDGEAAQKAESEGRSCVDQNSSVNLRKEGFRVAEEEFSEDPASQEARD